MIRNEELIDGFVASLHFHNYIELSSTTLFGEGLLNVVATDHQKKNIQDYIDDVFIDLFFRTNQFKSITIPKGWVINEYTKDGIVETKDGAELNLNNPYDRYTFIDCISRSVMSSWEDCSLGDFCKLFPDNRFLSDIIVIGKDYGSIWNSLCFTFVMPYGDEFEQYLFYIYGMMHSKYKPLYRAQDIFEYSKLFFSDFNRNCYKGMTNIGLEGIMMRQIGYNDIKDLHTFGEYTNEDIFMIFCLLVDKLKMEEYSFLSTIGLFVKDSLEKDCFLNEFRKFENEHPDPECLKPFLRERDLFLRFTSATKSKAVKFKFINPGYAEFQFFEDKPIKTVTMYNSLPLPILHNELY